MYPKNDWLTLSTKYKNDQNFYLQTFINSLVICYLYATNPSLAVRCSLMGLAPRLSLHRLPTPPWPTSWPLGFPLGLSVFPERKTKNQLGSMYLQLKFQIGKSTEKKVRYTFPFHSSSWLLVVARLHGWSSSLVPTQWLLALPSCGLWKFRQRQVY